MALCTPRFRDSARCGWLDISEWGQCCHGFTSARTWQHVPELVRESTVVRTPTRRPGRLCLTLRRDWYFSAQQIQYVEDDEEDDPMKDSIPEEDEDTEEPHNESGQTISKPASTEVPVKNEDNATTPAKARDAAGRDLARDEILALIACFIGPVLGAYLLHAIRSQLTRPAEGLVSNYNLTIFVMAAELRPVSHIIKLRQARIARLQRIVRADVTDRLARTDAQELLRRLGEIEARLAEPITSSDVETLKIGATVRQGLQPQLDALNRAVRRYEKRQAAQSIQMEARFGDMELRLKDALSLAAVAARNTERPGIVSLVFTWIIGVFSYCFQIVLAVTTYPFRVVASIAGEIKSWFIKTERQPRKRLKGHSNGHSSVSTPRLQSRSGR